MINREAYDNRQMPTLYVTKDFTARGKVLFIKGDEFSTYHYNYGYVIELYDKGVLSITKPEAK